jgi:triosephosphate isomerase
MRDKSRRLIAGNWMMNLSVAESVTMAKSVVGMARDDVEIAIFPGFVALANVAQAISGSNIRLGAQDVFWRESGAYTGEVSPKMLIDVGCIYCIVGHSERRGRFGVEDDSPTGYFSDTDESVTRKARALLQCGIVPVLCVGETISEKESGEAHDVLERQLAGSLKDISAVEAIVAYEPVWAIGTGQTCEPEQAAERCQFIRQKCGEPGLHVLYGGSVKPSNARSLFEFVEIDGALVGGASLNSEEFSQIIELL